MAEKLPDVVVTEMIERLADVNVTERMNDSPPSYEDSQTTEARNIMVEMKSKADADRKEVRKMLNQASQVKEENGESFYSGLFGMLVQDCEDSILKKEVVYLTMEMCRFRKNISEKMLADESLADAPMNIARLSEGFNEGWRLWRARLVSSFSDYPIYWVKKRLRAIVNSILLFLKA